MQRNIPSTPRWNPVAIALVAALVLGAASESWGGVVEVNSCGQRIRGRGVLSGDLDCSSFWSGTTIWIESGSLDLNGFTLTTTGGGGVVCLKSCRIIGPGEIHAQPGVPFVVDAGSVRRVKIEAATIVGGLQCGVLSPRILVSGSVITGSSGYAGVCGGRPTIKDSVITGNAQVGIAGDKPRVLRSSITGNGIYGLRIHGSPGRLSIKDSNVTGNGLDAACGVTETCADIAAHLPLRVRGTLTCDTSYEEHSGFPGTSLGVCALD